jgi:hypothetical protein
MRSSASAAHCTHDKFHVIRVTTFIGTPGTRRVRFKGDAETAGTA